MLVPKKKSNICIPNNVPQYSGIISSILTFSHFNEHFNNPSAALTGAVVATFTGGCFFGALSAGWWVKSIFHCMLVLMWDLNVVIFSIFRMSDKYGRKFTIQMGCVWALWGCSMQAGAPNIACLLIGRIVAGVAIGILSTVVPLYNVRENEYDWKAAG